MTNRNRNPSQAMAVHEVLERNIEFARTAGTNHGTAALLRAARLMTQKEVTPAAWSDFLSREKRIERGRAAPFGQGRRDRQNLALSTEAEMP